MTSEIPDRPGIWEWYPHHELGRCRLVYVCDVGPKGTEWLRIWFAGGYYDFNPESDLYDWDGGVFGKFVGELGSVPDEKLFSYPDKKVDPTQ